MLPRELSWNQANRKSQELYTLAEMAKTLPDVPVLIKAVGLYMLLICTLTVTTDFTSQKAEPEPNDKLNENWYIIQLEQVDGESLHILAPAPSHIRAHQISK